MMLVGFDPMFVEAVLLAKVALSPSARMNGSAVSVAMALSAK